MNLVQWGVLFRVFGTAIVLVLLAVSPFLYLGWARTRIEKRKKKELEDELALKRKRKYITIMKENNDSKRQSA